MATLPRRFLPFANQAATESAIRYGGQEAGLQSIFDQRTHDFTRDAQAQETAFRGLLGALQAAPQDLNRVYSDAGLTPGLLASLASTPTGARLSGELARGQAGLQQQQLGAQAGNSYQRGHLADEYQQDVGQINSQAQALAREKGLFQSQALNALIGGDRSMRHDANAAAKKLEYEANQAQIGRDAAQSNALIGQGLLPGADGTLQPLPGGKADPNAPGNQPKPKKRTTGPGTASPDAQRTAGSSFQKAVALAKGMGKGKPTTPQTTQDIKTNLSNGRPASSGKVVYEDVPVIDPRTGEPIKGKTKRQPKLDSKTGQQVTSPASPAVPAFEAPIAAAATEQALFGYVTTATVRELQKLGYSVNQIPGLKTENQAKAGRPKSKGNYTLPPGFDAGPK